MSVKQIVEGHLNELFNKQVELGEERMAICKKCPLMRMKVYGFVCDSTRYVNPETNEVSNSKKQGFIKGCGCRLDAKVRVEDAHCPAGKW